MNTRRRFLLGCAAGALAAPLTAEAQQATKVARIGNLSNEFKPGPLDEKFKLDLRELGWIDGRNIVVEYRWAGNNVDRLPILAQELVGLKVDLIVAWGTTVVLAAKNATRTIPIVMGRSADPVGTGIVASLARPGGNITGVSSMAPGLAGKRMELLREAIPGLTRVAFLAHGGDPAHKLFVKEAQDAAQSLALQVRPWVVKGPDEIEATFPAMIKERAGALIVQPIFVTSMGQGPRIAGLATSHRLPAISDGHLFAEVGGLMRYGPDREALDRRVAIFADRILRGAKPSDLPVEQPTKFELVINMKTAKALGLTIPQSVLVRADRVIE